MGSRILEIAEHKVKKGESLDSLGRTNGLTWQALAEFNWGTSVPEKINNHLRDEVGCTKKTASGKNYMFDDSDDPGIVFIPKPWKQGALQTEKTHTIRVVPLGKRLRLVIPVQADLDGDPDSEDQLRLRSDDGSFEKIIGANDTANVGRNDELGLLFFNFGIVADGKYSVAFKRPDRWCTILKGLEVVGDKLLYGGKRFDVAYEELGLLAMEHVESEDVAPSDQGRDWVPDVPFSDTEHPVTDESKEPQTSPDEDSPEGTAPDEELEYLEEGQL